MFQLTQSAAAQILHAAESQPENSEKSSRLRIAAKIEDGELVYGMGFDDERENDIVIESCGVTLLIAPRSQPFLDGATLDFVELKPGEFQFIFINPNDPSSPGCAGRGSACGSCGSSSSGGCGN